MEKILIVDDNELNREILTEMLGDDYIIVEASNGKEALAVLNDASTEISLVLLDMVMPEMDGLELLGIMEKNGMLSDTPVIMISADNSNETTHRAYELGVEEFIRRPFDSVVVRRRCRNVISLYAKQKKLVGLFADQFYEREKNSRLLIDILAHIVEFRNNESATHVINVQRYSEILLKELVDITDKYGLTENDCNLIASVSALHDIGKICIPDEVLNKPGKLTDEEFKIMKSHSAVGSQMLADLPFHRDEPLVKLAFSITRWHHERWDGRGYPDGLMGDDIPIAAQVVSIADVYDALTAERCYKKAFPHKKAMEMILGGQCGQFNPLLLKCLENRAEEMRLVKEGDFSDNIKGEDEIKGYARALIKNDALYGSDRLVRMLEFEKMKNRFLEDITGGCSFEFTSETEVLTFSKNGAMMLGVSEIIVNPVHDHSLIHVFGQDVLKEMAEKFRAASPEDPQTQLYLHRIVELESEETLFKITFTPDSEIEESDNLEIKTYTVACRSTWTSTVPYQYTGVIGKLIPNEFDYSYLKGEDDFDIKRIL